jgi:hypothetical protein
MTMAIGWINKSTLPPGRVAYGQGTGVTPRSETIGPGTFSDGQHRDGVDPKNVHAVTQTQYNDVEAKKHREALRGDPHGKDNPEVHSKNVKRYGPDGSKANFPHSSTGHSPSSPGGPELGSIPVYHGATPGEPISRTVGWAPDGSGRHLEATHPNANKTTGHPRK